MDCGTQSRILHLILIGEGRWASKNEERLLTFCMNDEGRKERESENATTKQKNAKSNGWQFKMSHADQHAHDKRPSQPFPKTTANRTIPHAQRPAVDNDVSFAALQTTETSRSQLLSGFLAILPID